MSTADISLKIRNYRVIEEAEIKIDKTILYGPNGGGKSSAIHALLILLAKTQDPLKQYRELSYGFREGSEIEVSSKYGSLKIKTLKSNSDQISVIYNCEAGETRVTESSLESTSLINCMKLFWRSVGIENIGYIRGDRMKVFRLLEPEDALREPETGINIEVENIDKLEYWQDLLSHPKIIFRSVGKGEEKERLDRIILEILGGDRIYNGYVYNSLRKTWYPLHLSAYGHRRALLFLYALTFSDIVMVEGFDNAFHIDLAIKLLELADRLGIKTVIETHTGLIVRRFLEKGWKTYYLEDGKSTEATKKNILYLDLFKRERELFF